jgi:hypothetical protein
MATTRTRPSQSANGHAAAEVGEKAKDAVVSAARQARGPALAAAAAAAGLAGGLALGSRVRTRGPLAALVLGRRKVLGIPVGPKPNFAAAAMALGQGTRKVGEATGKASGAADDLTQLREQLEGLNRRSPVGVVLEGLTHRRGMHRRET